MTKITVSLAILIMCITPLQSLAEDIDGGQVYARYCGSCHNFRPPGEKGDREWEMAIGHMRTLAGLTGKEARAVADFLESKNLAEPKTVSMSSGQTETLTGEQLVTKGACRACHIIGDSGGPVGPSLNGVLSRRSREYVATQILDPLSHNPSSTMPPHNFSAEELKVLIDYLEGIR